MKYIEAYKSFDIERLNEGMMDKVKEFGSKIVDKVKGSLDIFSDGKEEEIVSMISEKNISDEDMLGSVKELERKGFDMNSGVKGNWDNIMKIAKKQSSKQHLSESLVINEGLAEKVSGLFTTLGFGSTAAGVGALIYGKYFMTTLDTAWAMVSNLSINTMNIPVAGLTLTGWVYVLVIGIVVGTIALWYRNHLKKNR